MAVEYLNNRAFEAIIDRFKEAKNKENVDLKELEESQVQLAAAFYTLALNIITAFKFQLVDKDEALQEGVMICFEKLHRFDPKIGRAFNFCTTIILNHYRQLYRTAKNYNELKIKYGEYLQKKQEKLLSKKGKKRRFRREDVEETE